MLQGVDDRQGHALDAHQLHGFSGDQQDNVKLDDFYVVKSQF